MKDYGAFISFCGGVKGLVPLAELGLEPDQDANTHLPVGKVGFTFLSASLVIAKLLQCTASVQALTVPPPELV